MKCTICGKPVILDPSAAERAAKDCTGKTAAYYTRLFTEHADCVIAKRHSDAVKLIRVAAGVELDK